MKRIVMLGIVLTILLIFEGISANFALAQSADVTPPEFPVKLIFIHHSTGENWLADGYGNLGRRLAVNNYFVSDTNYGWGPNGIGDRTDIINWREWFRSNKTPRYLEALFNESGIGIVSKDSAPRLADTIRFEFRQAIRTAQDLDKPVGDLLADPAARCLPGAGAAARGADRLCYPRAADRLR